MLFATLDSAVSAHSTAVCSQICGQKPLSEHPRDRGQKAVFIVCRSAADGCFVAPVCRIVPLLERLSKSFMQGQAAQNLHRYRQRIPSRICPLKIKLTLQKYYFGLNLVSPQKLLHSHNLSGILRESMFEIRESTRSYEQVLFILPYPKKYCFISEVPPSLSQNHS